MLRRCSHFLPGFVAVLCACSPVDVPADTGLAPHDAAAADASSEDAPDVDATDVSWVERPDAGDDDVDAPHTADSEPIDAPGMDAPETGDPSDIGPDDTAPAEDGADVDDADAGAADTADARVDGSDDTADGRDAAAADAADTADADEVLDDLLGALRVDVQGTLRRVAGPDGPGWPAPLPDGQWLVVWTGGAGFAVAGDHDAWTGTPLRVDEGFAWALLPGPPGAGYKFTDGDVWVADPWSRSYRYDSFGELSTLHDPSAGLERWWLVAEAPVESRWVRVRVPPEAPDRVLYVHDGQNLFDPAAPWGGWQLDRSLGTDTLAIGIDNAGVERFEDYTQTTDRVGDEVRGGQAAEYDEFVRLEVRPFVRATYGEPGPVGTMGSSLGGLVSLWMAMS